MTASAGPDASATAGEIAAQPTLWRELGVRLAADGRRERYAELLQRPGLRVVLTGAGTSAFAGEVVAPVLRAAGGTRVEAVPTTTITADPRGVFGEDVPTLVVSFARSGDSPESVAAVALADELLTDCRHLVLTCNPDGRLATGRADSDRTDVVLMPAGSNDTGFAMTSSFTCMLLAARLLLGAPVDPERVTERLATSFETSFDGLREATAALAAAGHRRVVYLGSGGLRGLARESALKLLELTAGTTVAMADSSLGFRHGPKAFADADTVVVVHLSAEPYTRRYDLDIVRELRHDLGVERVVTVGAEPEDGLDGPSWSLPGLAGLDDALRAAPAVVGPQLFALASSVALGLNPDNPFPSGVVNRVVQGVTIHPWDRPAR